MWLAVAQGILLTLVAWLWLQIASIFAPESGVASSTVAMLAMAKGGVLIALALMYFICAAGARQTKGLAWWVGLLVSVLSVLILVSALLKGGSVVMALFWAIVPIIMIWYLLSPGDRSLPDSEWDRDSLTVGKERSTEMRRGCPIQSYRYRQGVV